MWDSVANIFSTWAPPQGCPEVDGPPAQEERAPQEVGESLEKPSAHMAARALEWVLLTAPQAETKASL